MTRLRKRIEDMVREALNAYNRALPAEYGVPGKVQQVSAEGFSAACGVIEDKVGDLVQEVLDEQDRATRDWAHAEESE